MSSWIDLTYSSSRPEAVRRFREFATWAAGDTWSTLIRAQRRMPLPAQGAHPHELGVGALGAEALLLALGQRHEHSLPLADAARDGTLHPVRSRARRGATVGRRTRHYLTTEAAILVFRERVLGLAGQIGGHYPVADDAGAELSGAAAWRKRIDLYNHWGCLLWADGPVDGKQQYERITEQALAWLAELNAQPLSAAESREVFLDRFDDETAAREEHLCDGPVARPAHVEARYAMQAGRPALKRALAAATDTAAMQAAYDAALASALAVTVPDAPVFEGDSQPLPPSPWRYSKGAGKRKWGVHIHAHTEANAETFGAKAEDRLAQGQVVFEPFEHAEFELEAGSANPAGGRNATLRRKTGATGHPAAGSYPIVIEARNYNGVSRLEATVEVA